jgi:phosphatidylglycerophosphatase A
MNTKTDRAASEGPTASSAETSSPSGTASIAAPHPVPPQPNPNLVLLVATAGGLGYFPKAPGTLGSLVGLALAIAPVWLTFLTDVHLQSERWRSIDSILAIQVILALLLAAVGVWSSDRVAKRFREKDPQYVVIDEVSGQHLTLLLGCAIPIWWKSATFSWTATPIGLISMHSALNWKYLLLGFILFRVFDIWKPFPARQAESLPGGWGIMTDDWIAGIYAAIGLWLARAAGF